MYDCYPLINAASYQIVGPSGSGKTFFITQLLKYSDIMFQRPFRKIYWLVGAPDGEHGATLEELQNIGKKIIFLNKFEEGWQERLQSGDAIIIDDLLEEATKEENFNSLFTKTARHKEITVFFLTQNLFHQGGQHRTRNLNVHYVVLFKNPRDSTAIDYLARQATPRKRAFMIDSYSDVTKDKPHSYLFFDYTQSCPDDIRVRTNIFDPFHVIIYKQNEN